MNKKGFAISVILYVIVFLIIAVFYILLGVIKSRYSVTNDLKNSVSSNLNSMEHIYSKLNNENPVSVLKINPNGGKMNFNGNETSEIIEIIQYADEVVSLPNPTRSSLETEVGTYTLSYDANGGSPTPEGTSITITGTTGYDFALWSSFGDCDGLQGNTYTFPDTYATTCTLTAQWNVKDPTYTDSTVQLAGAISRVGYDFTKWKDSKNNLYDALANYDLKQTTVMTAQWNLNAFASQIAYSGLVSSCSDVQCVIETLDGMLN